MAIRVLVVDDSAFFRKRLTQLLSLDAHIEVVGTAADGQQAIEQTLALHPDVITLDYEMPVLDGIGALRQIMRQRPTPVLMFSSLTHEGARVTLDALAAGAVDFLPKNFAELASHPEQVQQLLCSRIHAIAKSKQPALARSQTTAPRQVRASISKPPVPRAYKLVIIGSSTGGPVALQRILRELPADFPTPLLLIQHMPASFTRAFAERLDAACNIAVKEAEDGDFLHPARALLAPGGMQLLLDGQRRIRLVAGDARQSYRPSVDISFAAAANTYKSAVLALVLTGMGSDGCEGARLLKRYGAQVWVQDEASCVINGMPQALVNAHLADAVYNLADIPAHLQRACSRQFPTLTSRRPV